MIRHTAAEIFGILAGLLLASCGEQIVVPNSPARVTFDAIELTATQLIDLHYTLSDEEGDDHTLRVQVCEAPDLTRCGAPIQGPGSDGAAYVNTAPLGKPVAHRYRWDIGCGRLASSGYIASALDAQYIARIGVVGEPLVDSPPFKLSELGVTALPPCLRQ
jgi:hypothetical protein